MALHWSFNERLGTAIFSVKDGEDMECSIYQGNAFLIFLNEYKKDNTDYYDMVTFFVDENHMKNCLGITKGYTTNILNEENFKLKAIELSKNTRYLDKIIKHLVKGFDNIEIKIYTESEEKYG